MQFYKLNEPEYKSDYQSININGDGFHPYSLPGIDCSECKQTWGGSRILPYLCPDDYKNNKHLKDAWPIDSKLHLNLQRELINKIDNKYNISLMPGDSFLPLHISIPTFPDKDFLWCSIGSVVVSNKVKSLLEKTSSNDIIFYPVIFDKIGKLKNINKIPSTGEPEDIYDEIEYYNNKNNIPNYYEMIIMNESDYPIDRKNISICNTCKRESFDNSKRLLKMNDLIWKGNKIFLLKTTLYIIVTEEIRNILMEEKLTNLKIEEI